MVFMELAYTGVGSVKAVALLTELDLAAALFHGGFTRWCFIISVSTYIGSC